MGVCAAFLDFLDAPVDKHQGDKHQGDKQKDGSRSGKSPGVGSGEFIIPQGARAVKCRLVIVFFRIQYFFGYGAVGMDYAGEDSGLEERSHA